MFNKKLKQKIIELEDKLYITKELYEAEEINNNSLQEIIEAQAKILEAFAGYIVSLDNKTKKKGK